MPPIEIVAEEPVEELGSSAPPPPQKPKARKRRFRALTLRDHGRLLLPFVLLGVLGVAARLKYPYWWPAPELVSFVGDTISSATIM